MNQTGEIRIMVADKERIATVKILAEAVNKLADALKVPLAVTVQNCVVYGANTGLSISMLDNGMEVADRIDLDEPWDPGDEGDEEGFALGCEVCGGCVECDDEDEPEAAEDSTCTGPG